MLRLLITFALSLLPLPALASVIDGPWIMEKEGTITVIYSAPNMDYLFDQYGNHATVYHQGHGLSWYSQRDKNERIISQGYLVDPLPRPEASEMRPRLPLQEYSIGNTDHHTR